MNVLFTQGAGLFTFFILIFNIVMQIACFILLWKIYKSIKERH